MAGNFGFYADPALTTRIRGAVVMTVQAGDSARATIYFGSPEATEASAADGGQITITASGGNVLMDIGAGPAAEVTLGLTLSGGVSAAIPVHLSSPGPAADVVVSSNPLVEYVNG